MNILERIKKAIRTFFNIQPAIDNSITIQEPLSYEMNVLKNRILYRGDPSEINQLFHQLATEEVSEARFWAVSPSVGANKIRKIHSGLPSMIVETLAGIVVNDMQDVEFEGSGSMLELADVWKETALENRLDKLIKKATQDVLVTGDGAFKISLDSDISDHPIIEFYSGEKVQYNYKRGRIQSITFFTKHEQEKKTYTLLETYGYGFIDYELVNDRGHKVDINTVKALEGLQRVEWDDNEFMLAVPYSIYDSPKFEGRGRSIFDTKTDAFDALDETVSQWQDAVRTGRIKRYIPESMVPRNKETGELMAVNPLDNVFTAIRSSKDEGGIETIVTDQPTIQYEGYLNSYINNLDICLQGLISPSTIGIDTKKLDNAEAQREKEKTTLYTRDEIITVLREVIPELVEAVLNTYLHLNGEAMEAIDCNINFGEYANPSFEAQVETIGKASSSGVMSVEAIVESLWGGGKDDKWKEEEVKRIKQERGITELLEDEFEPNGYAVEEEMIFNELVDRVDNPDSVPNGTGAIPGHEQELEETPETGTRGTPPVDTVASDTKKKPEKVQKTVRDEDK